MHNVANKEMVMRNLWKLKNSDDKFKKLRITEDYTQEERSRKKARKKVLTNIFGRLEEPQKTG